MLEVICMQTDFSEGDYSQRPRGGKWLESSAAHQKAHQGQAGLGLLPQVTLGLH